MDILIPGIRDRRIAAADQWTDSDGERERYYARSPGRYLFADGTAPRRAAQQIAAAFAARASATTDEERDAIAVPRFDIRRIAAVRPTVEIEEIWLHSTDGNTLDAHDLPEADDDDEIRSHASVDSIIAHLVVLFDGTIVYTHDVEYPLNDVGASKGIDIEFAGSFANASTPPPAGTVGDPMRQNGRATPAQLRAGRTLVRYLKQRIPSIQRIHPHGQFTAIKRNSCPGPDVWVNVGQWAVDELHLSSELSPSRRARLTDGADGSISSRQANDAYEQEL